VKMNMEDLLARLRQGRDIPFGQPGSVPPVELKRLQQLKGTAELKLQAAAEDYEMAHANVAMLSSLSENPHLRHFYLRMLEHMTSVVHQMQAVHTARKKAPESEHFFIQCALGYVPVPTYGSDAGAAKLFQKGVLDTEDDVSWAVGEACRAIAYRFQDQAKIVQHDEVERFAHWFARPILQVLVSSVQDARVVTFAEKQPGERSFGLAIVTDLRQTTKHTVSKVIANGPAFRAGVQKGDFVVKIDAKRVDDLDHNQLLELLASLPHAKIELGRGKDWEPPKATKAVPGYFIRAIDRFRATAPLEEFDDDPLPRLFNAATSTGLVGGPLIPTIKGERLDPWKLAVKAGLQAISGEDEDLYFSSAETDIENFGFRRQLPACMDVYGDIADELKVLGWSDSAEFFGHNPVEKTQADEANAANIDAANTAPASSATEKAAANLLHQKNLEAEQLTQRVLDLEKQLRDLKKETSA